MATRSGGLIQDQNLNSRRKDNLVIQSTNLSRKKNVSFGGRRALADLSNSAKPSTCQALKKNYSNKLDAVDGGINACKPTSPVGGKINVLAELSKCEKPSTLQESKMNLSNKLSTEIAEINNVSKPISSIQGEINDKPSICQATKNHLTNAQGKISSRKALTDISNTESLCLNQGSKASHSMKMSSVADEQFLHNHKECIKSQTREADKEFFMRTLGLDDDSLVNFSSASVLLQQRQEKVESPLKDWKTVEIDLPNEVQTPFQCRTSELLDMDLSSQQCRTFKSPKFALVDTPAFSSVLDPLNFG